MPNPGQPPPAPGRSAPTPDQLTRPRPPGVAALGLVGDGFLDVAVGVPREHVGAKADAGAVEVLLGFLEGSGDLGSGSFTLTQGTGAEPGDLFGAAIATGDFNNDGFVDLAVGAPGEDVGGVVDAGAVNLFLTAPDGSLTATPSRTLTQGGNAERGDQFGRAVEAGGFGGSSGIDQLVVGAPGEDVGAGADAGAANVFATDADGVRTPLARTLTQSGLNERGDRFGATLAASFQNNDGAEDLVVGVPGEDVGTRVDAGAVNAFNGSQSGLSGGRLFTQFVNVESGDGFGAALGGLFPAL